ncbi:MAG: Calx-beta domain-containing protein [Microcoleaceae cyanobacterium]
MDIISTELQALSLPLGNYNSSILTTENITLVTSETPLFNEFSSNDSSGSEITPLPGSDEADFILATAGADRVLGLAGNDTIYGLDGSDFIQGNPDHDLLFGNLGNDSLYAGKGDDTLAGGQENDILFGDGGGDTLFGDRGADELLGNADDDLLYGGKENDLVAGGSGHDRIFGDLGDDTVLGDRGADTLTSGAGRDLIVVGDGTGGATLAEADVIVDFDGDRDVLALLNLLKPSDLNLFQGTGEFANDTIIQRRETNEFLAILQDVEASTLTNEQFQFQGSDSGTPTPVPIPTPVPTPVPTPLPGTLGFSIANVTVNEDVGQVQFTVNRTGGSNGAVSVQYGTRDGSATAMDYAPVSNILNFASGDISETVTVTLLDDGLVEGSETFDLVLSNPTGGATLGTAITTAIIVDNDVITLALSQAQFTVQEGTPLAEITVIRTGSSVGAVGGTLTQANGTAIAPGDYINSAIAVNFADGDTAPKTIQIPIVNDTTFELVESLTLTLTNPTGGAILGTQDSAVLNIVDNEPSSNLTFTTATYLGTTAADTAVGVKISPLDNAIITAGNFNGAGEVRRLVNGNTAPLSVTALGGEVRDLDVDRDSGEIVTVGTFGIQVFNSTAGTLSWSQPGTFDDVAIANNGTVITLTESTDRITLWSPTGTELATVLLTGTDIRPADVAIHPSTGAVFVTGFNQATSTLQIPFLRGFDPALNQIWNTWDYSAAEVTGQNLGADTRGVQIIFGQDGELYFLGRTDGGNNVFQRNGNDITQPLATKVEVDRFNNFSGAGGGSFTFHGKIDPATGEIEQGQFIVTRLSNGNANSFTPNSITADEFGNVYIGGSSAASLENRDSRTINNQPVGNYTLGEMAVLTLTPDYQVRRTWTPLTASGDADGSKGKVNGFAVDQGRAVLFGTVEQAGVATVPGALNRNPLGGTDTYLATWSI